MYIEKYFYYIDISIESLKTAKKIIIIVQIKKFKSPKTFL